MLKYPSPYLNLTVKKGTDCQSETVTIWNSNDLVSVAGKLHQISQKIKRIQRRWNAKLNPFKINAYKGDKM